MFEYIWLVVLLQKRKVFVRGHIRELVRELVRGIVRLFVREHVRGV